MSLPDTTTVLVVGAGPAGLAAALSLLHYGFHDFIIVDAVLRGENTSRAIAIHAATLEALDSISCGDDFVSRGLKNTGAKLSTRSTELLTPQIESLASYTRHPYVLIIPQNVTERLLEKKLESCGVTIHRPLRVIGLRQNVSDPRLSDVTFGDGRIITAKYVIGADGSRSQIRGMAGIGFSNPLKNNGGENNLAQMIIADVTFDTAGADQGASSGTLSQNNFFICFPLPPSFNESRSTDKVQVPISETVYRIGCGVPLDEGEIPHSRSKEYIQDLIDRFGPYCLVSDPVVNPSPKPTRIKDVIWSSRFRDNIAIADAMFIRFGESGQGGVILLVGDAAHIHSPVGGQGMNLGLRDAIFLGKALTNHVRATETKPLAEADKILREFATARRARALEVIGLTHRLQSIVGMKYRRRMAWWFPIDSETVRTWTLWVLGHMPYVQRKTAWELSGLSRR